MKKQIFKFDYPPGATPLDQNEVNGLIPDYISTNGELDQLEQQNILQAKLKLSTLRKGNILTDTFIRRVHKEMFKNVWQWAGQYRKSDKSIGAPWAYIPTEISKLCKDAEYWIANQTFDWVELGARFHHKLVQIHPFSNGNGRHSRLVKDLLLENFEQTKFT